MPGRSEEGDALRHDGTRNTAYRRAPGCGMRTQTQQDHHQGHQPENGKYFCEERRPSQQQSLGRQANHPNQRGYPRRADRLLEQANHQFKRHTDVCTPRQQRSAVSDQTRRCTRTTRVARPPAGTSARSTDMANAAGGSNRATRGLTAAEPPPNGHPHHLRTNCSLNCSWTAAELQPVQQLVAAPRSGSRPGPRRSERHDTEPFR